MLNRKRSFTDFLTLFRDYYVKEYSAFSLISDNLN